MKSLLLRPLGTAVACILLTPLGSNAALVTYSTDPDTLQLWHFDEAGGATAAANAVAGGTNLSVVANGATLGNAGLPGFGNALSTADGGLGGTLATDRDAYAGPVTLANGAGDNVTMSYTGAAFGGFTFEAVMRIDFDPLQPRAGTAAPMHFFGGEQDGAGGGNRSYQFRFDPVGFNPGQDGFVTPLTTPAIEFINVRNGTAGEIQWFVTTLPTAGANAVAQGNWYHVAMTYDGNENTPGNLNVYWTRVDPARTQADLLSQRQMNFDLLGSPIDFAVGNIARTAPNGNFVGLLDEARISGVARGAGGFIFQIPEPSVCLLGSLSAVFLAMRRRSIRRGED